MFGNTKYEKKDRLVQFFVSTFLDCLHYCKPDDNHELEFLIEKDGRVIPIEVKSGNTAYINNLRAKQTIYKYEIFVFTNHNPSSRLPFFLKNPVYLRYKKTDHIN